MRTFPFRARAVSDSRNRPQAFILDRLNYQHLYYFWMVAKTGSIKAPVKR
ncbi:MAG: hypothetical protein FD172_3791 [Methylocystaceae bacterium]|nr:MAG: hypothetical protein FD172_3791 [Methylocystaceae bacterium]